MEILSPDKLTLNIIVGIITALALIIGICAELQESNSGGDFEEHAYKEIMRICGWGTFTLGGIILLVQLGIMFLRKKKLLDESVKLLTP